MLSPNRKANQQTVNNDAGCAWQSPLFRAQNLHPLGVRYSGVKAGALQLLGDVCMTPLPINADFLEAAGSTEAKPPQLVRSPSPLLYNAFNAPLAQDAHKKREPRCLTLRVYL